MALNAFPTDTEAEKELVRGFCEGLGCGFAVSEVWGKGGEGALELAEKVVYAAEKQSSEAFDYCYRSEQSLFEKN